MMKRTVWTVLIFILFIFVMNPVSGYGGWPSGGGYSGQGHQGGDYNWWGNYSQRGDYNWWGLHKGKDNWGGYYGWRTPWYSGSYYYPQSYYSYYPYYYPYSYYYNYPYYYPYTYPYYYYPYSYPYTYYRYYAPPQRAIPPQYNQQPAPSTQRLFIYPRRGQNEKQQAEDQYQCHRWAVGQTGYDPTTTGYTIPNSQQSVNRANDYFRAMTTCLEARGYTVR
ncbi:MAG: hypothetical protein JW902_04690 [Syntrophaceae bacterium]|nr:hypothetical protein [Syntrophaceae bacterium]